MSENPKFIYKYFNQEAYCDEFLNKGRVLFRPLSYFLTCENPSLRDETEHLSVYKPPGGLKVEIEGRSVDATIRDGAMVFENVFRVGRCKSFLSKSPQSPSFKLLLVF